MACEGGFGMTIVQAEKFYEQDAKDYELENNREFLNWLNERIDEGYHSFMSVEGLQNLIDKIANWYEIKYPEKELEYMEGIRYNKFQDITPLSDVMDINQLFYRLSHFQLNLMECAYRATGWGQQPVYENGKEVDWKAQVFMRINKKGIAEFSPGKTPYFLLRADCMTGEVAPNLETDDYLDREEKVTLEELLTHFSENFSDELDFTELKNCVYDHQIDMELRNRVLQLVALKLLYSKNTTPERGYERAKRFIDEFNEQVELDLSTEEMDEIMYRDYTNDEMWKSLVTMNGGRTSPRIEKNSNSKKILKQWVRPFSKKR